MTKELKIKENCNTNGTTARVEKAKGKRGCSIKAYIPTEANDYMEKKRTEYGALYLANVFIKTDFNTLTGYVTLALVRLNFL